MINLMISSHIIVDFYQCDTMVLAKADLLKSAVEEALNFLEVEVQDKTFYQFEPQGVTANMTSSSINLNIHTWPEQGSCAIDLYCSSGHDLAVKICEEIKKSVNAHEYTMKVLKRL